MNIRFAQPTDNQQLLQLALESPMQGHLTVAIDRAPDYFQLARLQGQNAKVIIAEDGERIVGALGYSLREVEIQGRMVSTAYIGGVKIAAHARGGRLAYRLINRAVQELLATDIQLAVITVMAGNHAMHPVLEGRLGLPPFHRLTTFQIYYLFPSVCWADSGQYVIRICQAEDLPELYRLFCDYYQQYEFNPGWTLKQFDALLTTEPDFGLENFLVACQNGKLVGALSFWDQSSFKRTVVQRWSKPLKILYSIMRPIKNLPPRGTPLPELFLRHLPFAPGHELAARDLLRTVIREKHKRYPLFRLGVQQDHLMISLFRGIPRVKVDLDFLVAFREKQPYQSQLIADLRKAKIWEDLTLH